MKILILGSNSFSGSHMVNYLLENTNVEIIGLSRSPEYSSLFLPYLYKKERSPRFQIHQLDLNQDFNKIIDLLNKEKPEVVINFAAQGEVRNSWNRPEQWFQTNCLSIVKLTHYIQQQHYLKKYVAISTPEVYGSTAKNIKENFNFCPSTPYAASKLAGDLFLYTLYKKYNFPVVFTRAANVFGPHQQLYRIIPRTIIYLKMGKKIQLHDGGQAIRSFIHIKDVTAATWKAINQGKNGATYHLSPKNEEINIRNLVKLICEMMGHDFEESIEMIEENFGQDAIYSLDSTKARTELSWKPSLSLKEGIKETIFWIEDNWKEIQQQPLDYIHKR